MRAKLFTTAAFALVCQLSALAVSGPRVTFSCYKKSGQSSLTLELRNNGPDLIPQGTRLYYFYDTSSDTVAVRGSMVTDSVFQKGKIFDIDVHQDAQIPVIKCGCSLVAPRPEVGPLPTKAKPL